MRVIALALLTGWFVLFFPSQLLVTCAEFNYEIEKRIREWVSYYMRLPVDSNLYISNYRFSGGFPSGSLTAADRDEFLIVSYSLALQMVYYALEDGTITMLYEDYGIYREPGNSGYSLDDASMAKHLKSCVTENGNQRDCIMEPGAPYIRYVDGELELCPDKDSQADCSALANDDEKKVAHYLCQRKRKYCKKYSIEYAPSKEEGPALGFVPQLDFCHDVRGYFTQDIGAVVQSYVPSNKDLSMVIDPVDGSSTIHQLGNCYYEDGNTLVQQNLQGDYAYCGGNGKVCNNTFVGGFRSWDYDPRYRPWYIATKERQMPAWSDPYPFFDVPGLGITATHPMYDVEDGKNVFSGVLAVDYTFDDITQFLMDSYGDTYITVVIYEDAEPNYVIGTSTGTPAATLVLSSDLSSPCPVTIGSKASCQPVRVPMADLSASGNPMDTVLVDAFQRHIEAGYPKKLLTVKESDRVDSAVFISLSFLYEHLDANLRWRILIASLGETSSTDSIRPGNTLFEAIIAIGALGAAACLILFATFYRKRRTRAIVNHDWRFTCAFILGCALFNTSTFTLLGPNTNATCMLRMWTFHLFFVVALAPLFVKTWRMKQIVGQSKHFHRKSISNFQTSLYMLPVIVTQICILIILSFLDPPRQAEIHEETEGTITQRIICQTNTQALLITEIIFEAGLVLVGCVLAYQTRNLDKRFGESKPLSFAMNNICLVCVTFLIVMSTADITPNGRSLLQAIGVFWGTVFSSCIFVLPRLLESHSARRLSTARISGSSINLSNRLQISNGQLSADSD